MRHEISTLAARQHGVVAAWQLRATGVSADAVRGMVRRRRLIPVERGVYAVGHVPRTEESRWAAAALSCGPGAALSHRTAALLWRMVERTAFIDVTTAPSRRHQDRGRKVVHRSPVAARDRATRRGLPVTGPERTLIDLGDVFSEREIERALGNYQRLSLGTSDRLVSAIERHPGRRTAGLARLIGAGTASLTVTVNDFEERFLSICAANGIPRPLVNCRHGSIKPDFRWPAERLIVETDGKGHMADGYFESDRARDNDLVAAGWLVMRFTWRHLTERPEWVATTVLAGLARQAARAP